MASLLLYDHTMSMTHVAYTHVDCSRLDVPEASKSVFLRARRALIQTSPSPSCACFIVATGLFFNTFHKHI